MKYISFFLVSIGLFAQEAVVSPETVVLTVHGRKFTRAEFEMVAGIQKLDAQTMAGRLAAGESVGRMRALADEARRRGLDKDPETQAKIEQYITAQMNLALFNDILAEIHKDETLARKRLESRQHIAEERRMRQILIRHTQSQPVAGQLTPQQALAKAQELRKRIAGGASFAELARLNSDDARTKAGGGMMTPVTKPLVLPEFGAVAFGLKLGEVSEPVKTREGYHLILVEEIKPPAFEFVRKSIEWELARERMEQMTVTGVEMNPEYFGTRK